jgi:hypothetical protein
MEAELYVRRSGVYTFVYTSACMVLASDLNWCEVSDLTDLRIPEMRAMGPIIVDTENVHFAETCEVVTDGAGRIVRACPAAAALLNVAARRLPGRPFTLFFRDERHQVSRAIEFAFRGHTETLHATLHPRERRSVRIRISADPGLLEEQKIRWILTRVV